MRALALVSALALAACSNVLGIEDLRGPAGDAGADTPRPPDGGDPGGDGGGPGGDGGVPQTINFGGALGFSLNGTQMPLANTPIELHNRATLEVVKTQTNASGEFSFLVPTGGAPVDGYIHIAAQASIGLPPTTVYVNPAVGDVGFVATLFTGQDINNIAISAGETLDPASAFVMVQVFDPAGKPAANEQITPSPSAKVTYIDDVGVPNGSLTATSTLGIAVLLNAVSDLSLAVTASGPLVVSRVTDPLEEGSSNLLLLDARPQ